MIKIFGAAFDPLDLQERVDVKSAYLHYLKFQGGTPGGDFLDPFSYLESHLNNGHPPSEKVEWIGRFPVESWLTPKPSISDLGYISKEAYSDFLDRNGCRDYYNKLLEYLGRNMDSCIPVMIGVDHCLTGGVVKYLRERYDQFNVLVFDSHCDLIDFETRRRYFGLSWEDSSNSGVGKDIYECGSFLCHLLREDIIRPENLWIVGSQDLHHLKQQAETLFTQRILPWIDQGLHIIPKDDLIRRGVPQEIKGPTYISFDMDLGSLSSVLATRFLNYIGLDREQFLNLVGEVSGRIKAKSMDLIGLDIMEIDVHFLEAEIDGEQDYTVEIASEIIDKIVYQNPAI
jgi:arginase family enzyme